MAETILSSGYVVCNRLGVAVASFDAPERAFAFIADEGGRRGPLHVELVEAVERRQAVRRLRRVA